MQGEIDRLDWPVQVNCLGVNRQGAESGNAANCEGRTLPWLQDIPEVDAWGKWSVEWRDVVILNEDNERVAVFNLTTYDLRNPAYYDSLKTLLRQVAEGGMP